MIEILPVLNSKAAAYNPRLTALAHEFCVKNIGAVNFDDYQNVWVAVKGGPGEMPEVLGIACLRVCLDVPLLHTDCGSGSADRAVSAKLVQRLWSAILDQGFTGQEMMIHVAPEQDEIWKSFLDGIKAIPANRHLVTVHSKIEV